MPSDWFDAGVPQSDRELLIFLVESNKRIETRFEEAIKELKSQLEKQDKRLSTVEKFSLVYINRIYAGIAVLTFLLVALGRYKDYF